MTGLELEASGLELAYGPTRALRGADLRVAAGEVVALVGPSGSGKTSLLHCLAGLAVPDAGSVRVGDVLLSALDEDARTRLRRDRFGFVLQFGHLVPDLTLLENVAIPLLLQGSPRRAALRAARSALEELGVGDAADRHPGAVSGGQQQRAAVARALVADPAVVFADEPTGALDVANGDRVMELLVRAARDRSATVPSSPTTPRGSVASTGRPARRRPHEGTAAAGAVAAGARDAS